MKNKDINSPSDAVAHYLTEHKLFTEGYKVSDAFEIVAASRRFKLEILEPIQPNPSSKEFDVRVYERKEDIWVMLKNFPWCNRDSKKGVMMQGLSFLKDRLEEK